MSVPPWKKWLSDQRLGKTQDSRTRVFHNRFGSADFRVPHEKDFDRVVFSTPVRRLQDKTQVFPLDQHDSVRTRLTHSLEVANIARTLAAQLVSRIGLGSGAPLNAERKVPALVAAISIAHDIGNPPFGHQGEAAIRLWVKEISSKFAGSISSPRDKALLKDYLYFDGNPQGFRLLTKLQGVAGSGLDLTASTLRATFKYPWASSSDRVDPEKPKFGYFQTEKDVFQWCSSKCGLSDGQRHPLASIMEASDDICYSILDVEDGVKKELVSTAHLILFLQNSSARTPAKDWIKEVASQYHHDVKWLARENITGRHAEDVLIQLLRSYFISLAVSVAVPQLERGIKDKSALNDNPCLRHSECATFLELLKQYTKQNIYSHRSVERVELQGHRVIPYLLGAFWFALERLEQGKATKIDRYVVKQISQNYYRVYEVARASYPAWYARLQVVCDMVCGMTDSFALSEYDEFMALGVSAS